jgi:thioredoxin-like negative regulator of GroEL
MRQIFYFSADWCVPCQTFGPIMEQTSQKIQVQKINIDYEPNVIAKYGVKSVPTVILVENGQEVRRFVGPKSYQEVMNFING